MTASTPRNDRDTTERVERYERERIVERPAYTTPAAGSNVNVGPTTATVARNDPVWAVTRIVTLLFTVLEVLLLLRFVLKLTGANATQPLVSGLYRSPSRWSVRSRGSSLSQAARRLDLAALLAVAFFSFAALIVAVSARSLAPHHINGDRGRPRRAAAPRSYRPPP